MFHIVLVIVIASLSLANCVCEKVFGKVDLCFGKLILVRMLTTLFVLTDKRSTPVSPTNSCHQIDMTKLFFQHQR